MWLIVGLGNPGTEYENNRHNIGFMVLDTLAERLKTTVDRKTPLYHFSSIEAGGEECVLIKPMTFMNESGLAVKKALLNYECGPENLIVVFADLDLPTGAIRIREQGGSGGHRGMNSIIKQAGTEEFVRLRAGIGRPSSRSKKTEADYVLSDFKKGERKAVTEEVLLAAEAIECILDFGVTESMNRYNGLTPGED